MLLASYARASGALCRNERSELGARALGVSGASRAMACRPCVSGVGRESRRLCLRRVPFARCDTCPRAAHVVSREMRILLVRCSACSPLPFLHLGFPTVVFTCVKGTPMYGLKTESSFDAAHFLTDYHGKCENLHGHRWRVVAYLEQEELQTQGTHKDMVIDFADFKGALRDLTEAFDHSFVVEEGSLAPDTLACLEREGFSLSIVSFRTTAENLARYFYGKLADAGFPVSQVDVYETPNNCAIYRG